MTKHFIFDFETLGQNVMTLPVINCAYMVFDWNRFKSVDNPYTFEELVDGMQYDKFDVRDQCQNHGAVAEASTIEWWQSLPQSVRTQIIPSDDDISATKFIDRLITYMSQNKFMHYWSRSNSFDPIIMKRMFEWAGKSMDDYFKYWGVRDTRTFIDAVMDFPKNNGFIPMDDKKKWAEIFEAHNCKHDVAADILRLQMIVRYMNDLN